MKNYLTKFSAIFLLLIIAAVPLSAQPKPNQAALDEADKFFQAKDWTNAAKAYENVTKKEPSNSLAWNRLGSSWHSLGQYEKATVAYEKAIALNSNPISQYNLACVYAMLNSKEKAFSLLNSVAASGFFQPEQISADQDLTNLRDDLRFKEILSQAQKSARPCTVSPEYRQFDFWIGEWEVHVNGSGQPAGKSSVQLILGDCIIFENWTGARGMNGKSFNLYNSARQKWQQTWVNDRGIITEYVGEFKGDRLEYHAESVQSNGAKQLLRMTFFKLDPDRVRQFGEASTDEGKTWNVQYDLIYSRKK